MPWCGDPGFSRRYSERGVPAISPNAQVSWVMETAIRAWFGTLTAAGTNPLPQHDPGKIAVAMTSPSSLTSKVGDLPTGFQFRYSSPESP